MIFRQQLIDKIKTGNKTMTRRPVKPGEDKCRYKPGRSYAICPGRGKPQVDRITVMDVRKERLGDLTVEDARREGFSVKGGFGSPKAFFDYWRDLYGGLDPDQRVWVISFLRGDDTSRFMARPVAGRQGDYTTISSLAIDDLPVVTGEDLAGMAVENNLAFLEHVAAEGDLPSIRRAKDQINVIRREANASGRNVHSKLRSIERQLEQVQRQLRGNRAA